MSRKKNNLIFAAIGGVLALAAGFLWKRNKKAGQREKPPKGAPQLDLENPGDQSEFRTSSTESEIG